MATSPEPIPGDPKTVGREKSDLKSRTGEKMFKSKRAQSHLVEKDVGHEEGPTDKPSCTSMEIRRSERLRKQPKRKPFSDLTNALPLPCPLSPSSTPDVTFAKYPSSINEMGKSPEAIPSDLKSRTGEKMFKSKRAQSHLVEKNVGHEEGPTDRPTCTSMEIQRSERLRKQPKRKPFSDLTNALPLSCPLSPSLTPDVTSAKSPSSIISNAIKNHEIQNLSVLGSKEIPSDLDFDNDQTCSTSYVQQRPIGRKDKGKSFVVEATSSCPQLERTRSTRGNLESEHAGCHHPKSFSAPFRKPKKKQRFRIPKSVQMRQDFIEKQKAYFAEIDAFELPEEVVSESELE